MVKQKTWSDEETKRLRENINKSWKELKDLFPDRTIDSIMSKRRRILLSLPPEERKKVLEDDANFLANRKKEEITEQVYGYLKKFKLPVASKVLMEKLQLDRNQLDLAISNLKDMGIEIVEKEIKGDIHYKLRRAVEEIYSIVGELNTPLLLTGDWHIGSNAFESDAFYRLVEDVEDLGIEHVLINGDLIQSRGFHKNELGSLKKVRIQEQLEDAVEFLKLFPSKVQLHVTIGNHEQALKNSLVVGLDVLSLLDKMFPNLHYYGAVANFILNESYILQMRHGNGGRTYASSYPVDKLWDMLPEPKPDILVTGHFHRILVLSKPKTSLIIQTGSLQGKEDYLTMKGIYPTLGWVILNEYNSAEDVNLILRMLEPS